MSLWRRFRCNAGCHWRRARGRVAGDGVERLARSCSSEIIASLCHVWQVIPGVCSGVPGDRAGANSEVDVAACEQPSAAINSRGSSRAARRQIGDRGIVQVLVFGS